MPEQFSEKKKQKHFENGKGSHVSAHMFEKLNFSIFAKFAGGLSNSLLFRVPGTEFVGKR